MKTIFFRALNCGDKEAMLLKAIRDPESAPERVRFEVDPLSFSLLPRSPFAYWVSKRLRLLFKSLKPFESDGRTAKVGLQTSDNFRFIRLGWEVDYSKQLSIWFPYAKGGSYSPFYSDIYLLVKWNGDGSEMKAWAGSLYNNSHWSRILKNIEYSYRPGITWPSRTQSGFAPRALPSGCMFDNKGNSAFIQNDCSNELLAMLGVFLSTPFRGLICLHMSFGSYDVGVIQRTPIPLLTAEKEKEISGLVQKAWSIKRFLDRCIENSHAFILPSLLHVDGESLSIRIEKWGREISIMKANLSSIQGELDELCFELYGFAHSDKLAVKESLDSLSLDTSEAKKECEEDEIDFSFDSENLVSGFLSWAVGVGFGRFDIRLALNADLIPSTPGPFDSLPRCSPGMLICPEGLPANSGQIVSEEWLGKRINESTLTHKGSMKKPSITSIDYPLNVSWSGILADDPNFKEGMPNEDELIFHIRKVFELLWKDKSYEIEQEVCEILSTSTIEEYFKKPSKFFQYHSKNYSKSRRHAPIYWPLQTPSGSYTIWLYYHRLSDQTLFTCINDFIEPKLKQVSESLSHLYKKANRDRQENAELEELITFDHELKEFRDELLRVAKVWKPNLNDGVQITAAPLWRLFQHKSWQKKLKDTWKKLEEGKYDWAHLAYNIWPDRVIKKSHKDRSLAIAHDLEEDLWEEVKDGEDSKGKPKYKWVPKDLSEDELLGFIASKIAELQGISG